MQSVHTLKLKSWRSNQCIYLDPKNIIAIGADPNGSAAFSQVYVRADFEVVIFTVAHTTDQVYEWLAKHDYAGTIIGYK